jgi:hypothetical protein
LLFLTGLVLEYSLSMNPCFHVFVENCRTSPPIFTEGHGREPWNDSIEVSQTVGWFTTMFPVQIATEEGDDILTYIMKTKQSLASMPRNGWSYFASKYLNQEGRKVFGGDPIEVNFNFLGQFQQLERANGLMEALPLPPNCKPDGMPTIHTVGVIDVLIVIEREMVQAVFKYNDCIRHKERIHQWIKAYEKVVVDISNAF